LEEFSISTNLKNILFLAEKSLANINCLFAWLSVRSPLIDQKNNVWMKGIILIKFNQW